MINVSRYIGMTVAGGIVVGATRHAGYVRFRVLIDGIEEIHEIPTTDNEGANYGSM